MNYSGERLYYPFELRVLRFYEKCIEIEKPVHDLVKKCAKEYIYLKSLCLFHPTQRVGGKLHYDAERLRNREKWFNEARGALRLHNGPVPLSTQIQ